MHRDTRTAPIPAPREIGLYQLGINDIISKGVFIVVDIEISVNVENMNLYNTKNKLAA